MLMPPKGRPAAGRGSYEPETNQRIIAVCAVLLLSLICFAAGVIVGKHSAKEMTGIAKNAMALPPLIDGKKPALPLAPPGPVKPGPRVAEKPAPAKPVQPDLAHPTQPITPAESVTETASSPAPATPQGTDAAPLVPAAPVAIAPSTPLAPQPVPDAPPKAGDTATKVTGPLAIPWQPVEKAGKVTPATTPETKTADAKKADKKTGKVSAKTAPPELETIEAKEPPALSPVEAPSETGTKKAAVKTAAKGKGDYVIQVASFKGANRQANAEKCVKQLKSKSGVDARIQGSDTSDYIRVVVGAYPDAASAKQACAELKQKPGLAECFIKKLGQ